MTRDLYELARRVARHVTLVHDETGTSGSVKTAAKSHQVARVNDGHPPDDNATFMEDVVALALFLQQQEMLDNPTGSERRGRMNVRS